MQDSNDLYRIQVISMYLQAELKTGDPDQPADTDLHCFQNRINTVHVFSSCIYNTRRVGKCIDPDHRGQLICTYTVFKTGNIQVKQDRGSYIIDLDKQNF